TRVACLRLAQCLAHTEVALDSVEEDHIRPRLLCRPLHSEQHAPFQGFNRAQFAVLEAAILVSRLDILPWGKIETELDYLRIIHGKTAGEREQEAWDWLMETVAAHKRKTMTSEEREARIREIMEVTHADRVTAEFIVAQELGEIEGDCIGIEHGHSKGG
ncbi:MAG TPA: hypothetical protein VI457_11490, partial [Methylococcaceae bacterium]|nr:hypothetical protein [Methylococcaceae bacterium]